MPISFDNIPAQWRMPLFWAEVDPSMAGLPIVRQPALLFGTMILATKKVSAAVVAAGGTGYVVSNTINLGNGVVLTVATVTTGAVATVTVTNAGSVATAAVPTNPVAQVSTSGSGTGATFTLTWIDDITVPAGVTAGIAVPNVPKPIGTQAEADRQFGQGGELASMAHAFLKNNWAHEVWMCPVSPATGSVAAVAKITILTPPIEAGIIHLYIAGHHVDSIVVGTTDTPTTIAAIMAARINEDPNLPVIATATAADVTITCKTRGVNGNDITLQLNYYGRVGGEELPRGLTLTVPAQLGQGVGAVIGAGVPDYDLAIDAMGEHEYDYICIPHTDSNTLFDFEQEMGFEDHGRWGWMRQLYGTLYAAKRDTYSNLIIYGETRNFGPTSIMAIEPTAPSPVYEWAAAYCAKAARALTNDPARPLQTLALNQLLPAQPDKRFILPELNSISGVGIATQKAGLDHIPRIMRETTTYQLNLYGQSDDAYELVTTMATLAKLIRNQRHVITSKFPRHKLANDGTRFGVGQKIVTPKSIKGELIAQYRIDEFNGLVEDVSAFKQHLIVERDPNNPNRLNVLYPPDLVNQLRIYAVLVQFRLQYSRGQDAEIIR
jgi:phage tail sheath gpL-like